MHIRHVNEMKTAKPDPKKNQNNMYMHLHISIFLRTIFKKQDQILWWRFGNKWGLLTLKAPNKNCSRQHFYFCFFCLRKQGLMFHVNPLPSRGFTWNIRSYFLCKTMKCLWMSSTAVVIGALRVKNHKKIILQKQRKIEMSHLSETIRINLSSSKIT